MKRTTQKPDDQHDDQLDMWGAKTGATTGATRDKNVSVLKINASHFASSRWYILAMIKSALLCFALKSLKVCVSIVISSKMLALYIDAKYITAKKIKFADLALKASAARDDSRLEEVLRKSRSTPASPKRTAILSPRDRTDIADSGTW